MDIVTSSKRGQGLSSILYVSALNHTQKLSLSLTSLGAQVSHVNPLQFVLLDMLSVGQINFS
ncbi:hypothetical protein MKW98_012249 [Papaver atlanticum]|uniref:Uncharacterized protein n=1 Tax=Papaver atlanticum TaxID=357466 RepID=A0AAD4T2V0_9MAGN|nr:hypothetical protein MKW98_012249 [Papaver atlanticum]